MARRRARGEGSIRKRSDGRWEGRYTAGRNEKGKLIYKNVLARTQAECKVKLREALRNVSSVQTAPEAAEEPVSAEYTVGEWLRTWYELYSKPNLRERKGGQFHEDDTLKRRSGHPIRPATFVPEWVR